MPMNIAIDGPVGAGKSSIADQVAQRLHILHLDTGAMYRTVALYMLRNGIDPQDEQTVSARRPDTPRAHPPRRSGRCWAGRT